MWRMLTVAGLRRGCEGVSGQSFWLRWWRGWLGVFLLVLAGCSAGPQAHFPLAGPGLHRVIAGGSQGTMYAWWLPASGQNTHPRLLLWDGATVAVANPDGSDQRFTPLSDGLRCAQLALAPDGHAFACGQSASNQGSILIKSLVDLSKAPQTITLGSGPFTWAPDSQHLAYLHSDLSGKGSTCSVLVTDTSADAPSRHAVVLLEGVPFSAALGQAASSCPIAALAWSPAGDQVAVTLANAQGVNLELLEVDRMGTSAVVGGRYLLPGIALQAVDSLVTPSLFWSPDGKVLAALTGYQPGTEDGLYLLSVGAGVPLAEPHLTDVGEGAALAFSPDGRWLAVGTVGHTVSGENALLRVYDLAQFEARTLGEMLVVGSTLCWSPDSTMLAAASASKGGIALWSWPEAMFKQLIADQDIVHLHQLVWSPESTLLFSEGSHVNGPAYDEVYVQTLPVPPGRVTTVVLPGWFADGVSLLPTLWLAAGAVLLLLVAVVLLLLLGRRQLSRRARALARWTLGAGPMLSAALVLTSGEISDWLGRVYQRYSQALCQSSPTFTCSRAGVLALLTLVGPLVLVLAGVVLGAVLTGREHPAVVRVVPIPARRSMPRVMKAEYADEPPLLLPPRAGEAEDFEPPSWEEEEPPRR